MVDSSKVALRRAAAVVGGQAELARLLGYKDRRNVWHFLQDGSGPFPADHCPTLENETRRLAAEKGDPALIVTCEELRPDVQWGVLRGEAA